MIHLWRIVFLMLFFLCTPRAFALTVDQVPKPLKPWIDWVLEEEKNYDCPFIFDNYRRKRCSWAGRLILELDNAQGRFDNVWTVYQNDWIALPGDQKHWPQSVTVNELPATVIERNGRPMVYLPQGRYHIVGRFIWDSIPDNLAIPDQAGLLKLTIDGKDIPYPTRKKGAVWLKESDTGRKKAASEQNRLDLQVFRKVYDDVPLQLITVLQLEVSGRQREITLPHALLPTFIPVSLDSPLPTRLEKNGVLRIQVRPGRWQVELIARHPQPFKQLPLDVADPDWPKSEIWVFQGLPYQRLVEIESLPAIDPSQTNLPMAWRNLPAYRVNQGDKMVFKVIRRGDPDPEPNRLNLQRTLWLDFDGDGYTVEDRIDGKMTHGWRLDVLPEMQLGQVQLNGQNQLITRLNKDAPEGIEVRKGALQIKADSRIDGNIDTVSAVGWQEDFHQVRAQLNIPPGWRLLAAAGVDNDPNSWISRWTLLDLFLVLIAALAISRLWNIYWGAFALFGLVLIWHEPEAPRFIWLNILAAIALIRVLPAGRLLKAVKWYRNLSWLALLLIVIPFMVYQVRVGLYPQLEKQWQPITPVPYSKPTDSIQQLAQPMVAEERADAKMAVKRRSHISGAVYDKAQSIDFERIDPNAKIQTGPGLPQWQWHRIQLSWNGRVDRTQQVDLWYLSPPVTMLLNFVRVILVAILVLLMFGMLDKKLKLAMPNLTILLLIAVIGSPADRVYAAFPDEKILGQLKKRLLEPPDCLPNCAQIASMHLKIDEQQMRIQLQIHAQQDTAVPLPAQDEQWYPSQVWIDDEIAGTLLRQDNGRLWLAVPSGRHDVKMVGINPLSYRFTLPLPLKPHRVDAEGEGWRIDGVYENGRAADQLHFSRLQNQQRQEFATLQPTALPPFIRIERTLRLGLDWRIDTRVVRVQRTEVPVVLAYPLLPGESVTTANIRIKDRKVLVNMPAGQQTMHWQSLLDKNERIEMRAADNSLWTEVWRADVSPIWHLETTGISVVHHQDRQGRWLPEWRPWPGEKISLHIVRPQAVAGETLTIDKSELRIKPGKRSREAFLQLSVRSSKGGQHTVVLPDQAILQSVLIDGVTQPIRQKGTSVTLPVKPGEQQFTLNWHENRELESWLTTPKVNLAMASVNSHIRTELGHDRWVLFTMGPKFGPAALIWGVLIVFVPLAFGLGKIPLTPLKHWQWFFLLVGLSQIPVAGGILVVMWLIVLGVRREKVLEKAGYFNLFQVLVAAMSVLALMLLFYAVQQGLLGSPDMQIAGNHSNAYNLNWYQDRNIEDLPTATVVSLPLLVYRLLMLLWSLWLAVSLLDWLKWGWQCFSTAGLWKKSPAEKKD